MEKNTWTSRLNIFTVRQLSVLFGKSEDTIRRWRNEGVGKGGDNVRLRSVEQDGPDARRNSRHLSFTKASVLDFVQANPFLMDDAPELCRFMEETAEQNPIPALPALPGTFGEDFCEECPEDDMPFIGCGVPPRFREEEDDTDDRRPFFEDEEDEREDEQTRRHEERQRRFDEASLRYMLVLLHRRESECSRELSSARQASSFFFRRRDIAEAFADGGDYISDLVDERETQLRREMEKIRENCRALEGLLY